MDALATEMLAEWLQAFDEIDQNDEVPVRLARKISATRNRGGSLPGGSRALP